MPTSGHASGPKALVYQADRELSTLPTHMGCSGGAARTPTLPSQSPLLAGSSCPAQAHADSVHFPGGEPTPSTPVGEPRTRKKKAQPLRPPQSSWIIFLGFYAKFCKISDEQMCWGQTCLLAPGSLPNPEVRNSQEPSQGQGSLSDGGTFANWQRAANTPLLLELLSSLTKGIWASLSHIISPKLGEIKALAKCLQGWLLHGRQPCGPRPPTLCNVALTAISPHPFRSGLNGSKAPLRSPHLSAPVWGKSPSPSPFTGNRPHSPPTRLPPAESAK